MPRSAPVSKKRFLHFSLLVAVIFLFYANILPNPFVWDDHFFILQNEFIRHWKNIPLLFQSPFFSRTLKETRFEEAEYYRPIVMVLYTVEYPLWGLSPLGYHLVSILLHCFNAFWVYLLIQHLFHNERISFVGSLLFASHPLQTEAVSYLPSRADLLATFFCLTAFLLSLSSKKISKCFSLFSFALGLLSKETAVVFPALLFLFELCRPVRPKKWFLSHSAYWLLLFGYLALRLFIFPYRIGSSLSGGPGLLLRVLSLGPLIFSYLSLLIFPFPLHLERAAPFQTGFWEIGTLVCMGVGAMLLVLGRFFWNTNRLLFFGGAWFLVALVPVSNIIPIYPSMAEHYLYLPSVGFFALLSFYLCRFRKVLLFALLGVLACYGVLIVGRNRDYSDEMRLFEQTVASVPKSPGAHNNLGSVYISRGYTTLALREFKKSLSLNPNQPRVWANLGTAYREMKQYDKSIKFLKKALRQEGDNSVFWNKLGIAYAESGREEAPFAFQEAIRLDPTYGEAYFNLGSYYWNKGEFPKTLFYWEEALRQNPGHPDLKVWLPALREKLSKKEDRKR
ncbi:MAG: tetratricopeptide repeat protein [Candidatus Omnitrophica bacterium]|nr:tetratricopeptide repeat protein [Candidatus Omnitrophota bacterium]